MRHIRSHFVFAVTVLISTLAPQLFAQVPEWIWHDNKGAPPADDEVRFFLKTFSLERKPTKAVLSAAGDDHVTIFLNGKQVLKNDSWQKAEAVDVTQEIKSGQNVIAARGQNDSSAAGIIAKLDFTWSNQNGETKTIDRTALVTDITWVSTDKEISGWEKPAFTATDWTKPRSLGRLGVQPWGDVLAGASIKPKQATPAEALQTLPGFKVELLHSAQPGEGSWVSMTLDHKGRLIISPQGKEPMLRLTLGADGHIAKMETIDLPVSGAMGMLDAFDSLYVNGQGKEGYHLYRFRDTDGDDKYDSVELLRKWKGGAGEHGAHGIVLGADKKLYVVDGNFVEVPEDISPNSPHRNYADDRLLPRAEDGNGFGAGKKPPGGFVLRFDPDGKNPELFASGFRNTYDIAFNEDGELFGFDSDMEWDWGMPWYRPTRINHIVSGGDYGFREGSAKWPIYYPDSLPTTVDIGIGSPTGVKFGTNSKFPQRYKKAFYAMDWSYGRIVAVHLDPQGATYGGTFENFVAPKSLQKSGAKTPLNVTDLEFGQDGAMYFTTGGRGAQSGLYRVSYTRITPIEHGFVAAVDTAAKKDRELRHQLEAFHGKQDPRAVEFLWPHLNSKDRWIRYAARIALESQDVDSWQSRALEETRTDALLTALLALARKGSPSVQKDFLDALNHLVPDEMSESQKLDSLRVLSLAFIRLGRPNLDTANEVTEAVSKHYPTQHDKINQELCQLLIYLEAPDVVPKTLALLDTAETQEDQIRYIFYLRTLKSGWTLDQRRQYFSWFNQVHTGSKHPPEMIQWFQDVGSDYRDGSSFPKFIANFRKHAVATLTDPERTELAGIIAGQVVAPKPAVVQRTLVKEWKTDDLLPALDQVFHGRSFAKGEQAFNDAQCLVCHRLGNAGGSVGPDLTAISSRFTRRDILDSILEPSKVVSEQYQNMTLNKKDGDEITGRIVEEDDQKVVLITNPLTQERTEVRKADIKGRAASKVSSMPEALVNILTKEEILDLVAYLEAGGKSNAAAFSSGK